MLVPRITYYLTVAAPGVDDIDGLERSTWLWMAKKIGLAPTQCRDFLHAPRERGGLGMESWHSVVLLRRRTEDLAMEWAKPEYEVMAAVYAKMREDHEDIKRRWAWGGLGWGSDQLQGPYQYWPALEGYCQGEWVEGLERSLVKEGWGWIDGQGAQMWRVGDSRLAAAIFGARLGEVGFSTSSKLDMWMRGVKFRSELVGPDGTTVLPWGGDPRLGGVAPT